MCNNAVGWLYARGVVEEDGEKKPIMNFVAPLVLSAAAVGGVVATLNAL